MAHSNEATIEIIESDAGPLRVRELYIDGGLRASVERRPSGAVKFRFYPAGAFDWQEAKIWLRGLMELAIHAEEMNDGR